MSRAHIATEEQFNETVVFTAQMLCDAWYVFINGGTPPYDQERDGSDITEMMRCFAVYLAFAGALEFDATAPNARIGGMPPDLLAKMRDDFDEATR